MLATVTGLLMVTITVPFTLAQHVVVRVDGGPIKGMRTQTFSGVVTMFLGVPYAQPPTGPYRFRKPKDPTSWEDVLDTTDFRDMCPQDITFLKESLMAKYPVKEDVYKLMNTLPHENTSEDCLHLNIYIPGDMNSTADLLPVMLYFHGGSFLVGSGMLLDGSTLASKGNVIVVTMNYRLGVLGFLSTGDNVASGNWGLLDQLQAMQWLKRNIQQFGGDPNKITIFGDYAGSISVNFHILSPLSRGKFDRAISLSGVANFDGFNNLDPNFQLKGLARDLGCSYPEKSEIVQCLRSIPVDGFINGRAIAGFQPIVDGHFLPAYPNAIRVSGDFFNVPYMIGFNQHDESLTAWRELSVFALNKSTFVDAMTQKIMQIFGTEIRSAFIKSIIFEYSPDETSETDYFLAYVEAWSDYSFLLPAAKDAMYHSQSGGRTFLFNFDGMSSFSTYAVNISGSYGSFLPYATGVILNPAVNNTISEIDKRLSEDIIQVLVSFAHYGSPDIPGNKQWPNYNNTNEFFAYIDTHYNIKSRPKQRKLRFWTEFLPDIVNNEDAPCTSSTTRTTSYNRKEKEVDSTTTSSFISNTTFALPTLHSTQSRNRSQGQPVARSVTLPKNSTSSTPLPVTEQADMVTTALQSSRMPADNFSTTMTVSPLYNSSQNETVFSTSTNSNTTSIDDSCKPCPACLVHLGTVKLDVKQAEVALAVLFFLSIFLFVMLIIIPIWFAARDAQLSSPIENNF